MQQPDHVIDPSVNVFCFRFIDFSVHEQTSMAKPTDVLAQVNNVSRFNTLDHFLDKLVIFVPASSLLLFFLSLIVTGVPRAKYHEI